MNNFFSNIMKIHPEATILFFGGIVGVIVGFVFCYANKIFKLISCWLKARGKK